MIQLSSAVLLMSAQMTHAAPTLQSLKDVYQQALQHDSTWAAARYANQAAQEKLTQGQALFGPTVNLNGSATHAETDIQYTGSNSVFRNNNQTESFNTINYGVNVTQPLYRKQNNVQYQQSAIQVDVADLQLKQDQQDLMMKAAQAYFDVLLAQDKLDLNQAQKNAIAGQLNQAQASFKAGVATITDVDEAQAKYDLVQSQEITATNDLENKKRAVQILTGQYPNTFYSAQSQILLDLPVTTLPDAQLANVQLAQNNNAHYKLALSNNAHSNHESNNGNNSSINETSPLKLPTSSELAALDAKNITHHNRLNMPLLNLPSPNPEDIDKTNKDINSWLAQTEQNNLTLQIKRLAYEYARQQVELNYTGHLPTVDAIASYTKTNANGGINGFGNDLNNATIGVQFQVPIYQGGTVNSKVREAVANQEKAEEELEAARRKTEMDTRQAYLDLKSSIAQTQAGEQALRSSQSQLNSTHLSYKVGIRTSVDVLNAQQQLFNAKRDLLQARYSYLLGILKLKYASSILHDQDLEEVNDRLVGSSN